MSRAKIALFPESKKFRLNDWVMLRMQRKMFFKENPLLHPTFEAEPYQVTHINKDYFPYKYTIVRYLKDQVGTKTKIVYMFSNY